jgi:hypothetical protein
MQKVDVHITLLPSGVAVDDLPQHVALLAATVEILY